MAEAQRLRGRLQFADSQLFGRASRFCLRAISAHTVATAPRQLSEGDRFALRVYRDRLKVDVPRLVSVLAQDIRVCQDSGASAVGASFAFPWYSRVPSPSNPSDRPSREPMTSWTWKGRQIPCWDPAGVLERLLVWLRQEPAVKWG